MRKAVHDSVAQLVEQLTLNQWVVGSSPTGVTTKRRLFFATHLQKVIVFFVYVAVLALSGGIVFLW